MIDKIHTEKEYFEFRKKMLEEQLINRGIHSKKVLRAMLNVPRHLFMPGVGEG